MIETLLTFDIALDACQEGLCPFCEDQQRSFETLYGVWRHLDNWHYGQALWPQLDSRLRKDLGEPV